MKPNVCQFDTAERNYLSSLPFQSLWVEPLCFLGSGWSLEDQEFRVCQPGPCEEGRERALSPSTGWCCPTFLRALYEKKTEAQWGSVKCHAGAIFHKWEETREHLRVNVETIRRSGREGTRLGRHSDVPKVNILWSSAFTCHCSMWTVTYSTHSFRIPSKPFRHFGHMWLFDLWLKPWKPILSGNSFNTAFK